jgi:hypothetical protein
MDACIVSKAFFEMPTTEPLLCQQHVCCSRDVQRRAVCHTMAEKELVVGRVTRSWKSW